MPYKDLPSLSDLQDEGKGIKKTKAKDTPLKPPTLCRFRDVLCLENQKKNGGQISANTTDNSGKPQIASVAPKSESNWFKRVSKKVASAFFGASLSTLVNPSSAGNSFLPAATAPVAPPPPHQPLRRSTKRNLMRIIGLARAAKIYFPGTFTGVRRW